MSCFIWRLIWLHHCWFCLSASRRLAFAVLVRTDDPQEIEDLKSRIRSCLSDLNRVAEAPYELTVSIGAAKAEKDMPLKLLIEKADAALYEDKRH
jgi:GGDEF domain-containing protein